MLASQTPPLLSTMTSKVFERLRADILEGRLAPGQKLKIERLCEMYAVGASPLREALNRLVSFRLVEQIEQRGFRVAPVSPGDMEEIVRTRCWINEIAVREAVANADDEWEDRVAVAFHRLWKYSLESGVTVPDIKWESLHRKFHSAIVSACPSRPLLEFHEVLSDAADRHRHLAAEKGYSRRDVMSEHRAIMEAATKRDAVQLLALLNEHYTQTFVLASHAIANAKKVDTIKSDDDLLSLTN